MLHRKFCQLTCERNDEVVSGLFCSICSSSSGIVLLLVLILIRILVQCVRNLEVHRVQELGRDVLVLVSSSISVETEVLGPNDILVS